MSSLKLTSSVFLFMFAWIIFESYAVVPPLGDVNCKEGFCDSVTCSTSNCTLGKLMNDPSSVCGCCKICISYIGENEDCGTTSSTRECGPGLSCTKDATTLTYSCKKLSTACFTAQADYDDRKKRGTLGMYEIRPNCNGNGEFVARKCQPGGSCYCVDKDNNRIFGESEPSRAPNDTAMNCECSRAYHTALAGGSLVRTVQFPHCLPNGNYDQLQCVNQACFCIDSSNRSLTSTTKPITDLTNLTCYNEELHVPNYYRTCEGDVLRKKVLISSYGRQNMTVLGVEFAECSPDGYYQPLRETESKYFCADPFGKQIENFEVYKELPDSKGAMNCKCARTRYWLASQNVAKPFCCKNGNYRSIQCRGGVCFCVDTDGNQNGVEVQESQISELSCYNDTQYPFC